jgi:uroporphyrinogen-III decarboxylase
VFNLGHGVLPDTPLENVEAMVEAVVRGAGSIEATSKVKGAVR